MIRMVLAATLALVTAGTGHAKTAQPATGASYETLVRTNAAKFHRNFSAGRFQDNGLLVTPDIDVDSNNVKLTGAQNFVDRLKRYSIPFPGLQLRDRIRIVEGNKVATNYILQGEQKGPYGTVPASGHKIEAMSGELFEFNSAGLMNKLITVTELDRVSAEVKGSVTITAFEPISLLPNAATTAAKKEKIRTAAASFNRNYSAGTDDRNAALVSPGVEINADSKLVMGKAAIVDRYKALRSAFPDLKITNQYVLVDGDRAAVEYVIEGTQTRAYRTPQGEVIAPTGKAVRVRGMDFMGFDPGGHLTSLVIVHNADDFGTQLGK